MDDRTRILMQTLADTDAVWLSNRMRPGTRQCGATLKGWRGRPSPQPFPQVPGEEFGLSRLPDHRRLDPTVMSLSRSTHRSVEVAVGVLAGRECPKRP